MSLTKIIATLGAAAALAMAPAAFAANNQQGGTVVQQSDLEKNGWYCMQSSETPYYWVCTKVFGQTYECHFGICSPTAIRPAGNRVTRTPNGTATAITPQTSTSTSTATTRAGH